MGGQPRIEGRRISVLQIVEWIHEEGMAPETVAAEFDLDMADIYRGLTYYYDTSTRCRSGETAAKTGFARAKRSSQLRTRSPNPQEAVLRRENKRSVTELRAQASPSTCGPARFIVASNSTSACVTSFARSSRYRCGLVSATGSTTPTSTRKSMCVFTD